MIRITVAVLCFICISLYPEPGLTQKQFEGIVKVLGISGVRWMDDGSGDVQRSEIQNAAPDQAAAIMALGNYDEDRLASVHFYNLLRELIQSHSPDAIILLDYGADANHKYDRQSLLDLSLTFLYKEFAYEVLNRVSLPADKQQSDEFISSIIRNKDTKFLDALEKRGVKVANAPYAMISAVDSNDPVLIGWMLAHGGDVNSRYGDATLLFRTAENSSTECLDLLIKSGADIKRRDTKGQTVLKHTIGEYSINYAVVDFLLLSLSKNDLKGILYDGVLVDIMHATPAEGNPFKLLKMHDYIAQFIELGARVDPPPNSEGDTPLLSALDSGWIDIADLLIKRGARMAATKGDNALMKCARHGVTRMIGDALAAKIDINAVNDAGQTALIIALNAGYTDFAAELIRRGADTLKIDNNKDSTFSSIIMRYDLLSEQKGIIRVLASTKGKDATGASLLAYAFTAKKEIAALDLIENGAELRSLDAQGNSACILAIKNDMYSVFRAVLSHDPKSVNITNKMKETPLIAAIQNSKYRYFLDLLDAGADVNQNYVIAKALRPDDRYVFRLLDKKVDVKKKDENGRGLTSFIGYNGSWMSIDLLAALEKKGLNLKEKDKDGKTLLMFLSTNSGLEYVRYLVEKAKLDVNAKDKNKHTSLYYFMQDSNYEESPVYKYLVEKGAKK